MAASSTFKSNVHRRRIELIISELQCALEDAPESLSGALAHMEIAGGMLRDACSSLRADPQARDNH